MFFEIFLPRLFMALKISIHNCSNPNSNSKSDFYLVHLIRVMTSSFRIFSPMNMASVMGFILNGLA